MSLPAALSIASSLLAQAGSQAHARPASPVPFVGCASYGQTEKSEAPKGQDRVVPIRPADARKLAYYKSGDGIGILAPRGWYCEGSSGSGGMALLLGPKPFDSSAPGWSGFEGPAIEVYYTFSETSGKFNAAETMARVFPAYRAWARSVLQELDQPIPFGPYPTDTLTDRSESVVEYKTPAQTEGLGTHSTWLRKSDLPIAGAAILIKDSPGIGDAPDVLLLAIRLPAELASLTPLIVRNAEHDTRDAQSSPR